MTSFGVVSKEIAQSIQSCFLYLLVNFQGWATTRNLNYKQFSKELKKGNYFCVLAVCDVIARNQQMAYI